MLKMPSELMACLASDRFRRLVVVEGLMPDSVLSGKLELEPTTFELVVKMAK